MTIKYVYHRDIEEECSLTIDRSFETDEVTVTVQYYSATASIVLDYKDLATLVRIAGMTP